MKVTYSKEVKDQAKADKTHAVCIDAYGFTFQRAAPKETALALMWLGVLMATGRGKESVERIVSMIKTEYERTFPETATGNEPKIND